MSTPTQPTTSALSPIRQVFASLKQQRRIGLMPFIPAAYPDLETTIQTLIAVADAGASVIEVGIPFSDPIADGPTIQAAFTKALERNVRLADIFAAVAQAKKSVRVPMVAMVSFSIVFRHGVDRFMAEAKTAGFDGVIVPDLPPPEAQRFCGSVWSHGLDTILLVAPTTAPARRKEIADLCTGFIYFLSVSGITGERAALPADLTANLAQMKSLTDRPVCVGFGISNREHVKQLASAADGAIVGSAVVKHMNSRLNEGPAAIAKAAGDFVRDLLA